MNKRYLVYQVYQVRLVRKDQDNLTKTKINSSAKIVYQYNSIRLVFVIAVLCEQLESLKKME